MTRSPQKQTPQKQTNISWTGLAISMALTVAGFEQFAGHAQVPAKGVFTAQQDCVANQAIEGKNPGSVRLTIGQQYESVGFNSDRRTYILLRVPNATPAQRWVNADCGEFQAGSGTPGTVDNPGKKRLMQAARDLRIKLCFLFRHDQQSNSCRQRIGKPRHHAAATEARGI